MLIPSDGIKDEQRSPSLSRRVNANSQLQRQQPRVRLKLIKKGEC